MKIKLLQLPVSTELRIPYGLISLASYLRCSECKSDIQIIDHNLECASRKILNYEKYIKYIYDNIERYECDVLGIGTMCNNIPIAVDIANLIKKKYPATKIVFGGPQATSTAKVLLESFSCVDIVVRGEGEITFHELVNSLSQSRSIDNIDGLSYRDENGLIVENDNRKLIDNLDDLPIPDYSLVDVAEYARFAKKGYNDLFDVEVGRGCPFNCAYCSTSKMWQRRARYKSTNRIFKEIVILRDTYKSNQFSFTHDHYTFRKKEVYELCSLIREENKRHKINFKWGCSARLDSIDFEMIKVMHDAGCTNIFYGIETASLFIQEKIHKKIDLKKLGEIADFHKELGMKAVFSFIIGFPFERESDLNETLKMIFSLRSKSDFVVQLHSLCPLNNTSMSKDYGHLLKYQNESNKDFVQPFILPAHLMRLISENKTVFMPFYRYECTAFAGVDRELLKRFYTYCLNRFPKSMCGLFNKIQPVRFFIQMSKYITINDYPAPYAQIDKKFDSIIMKSIKLLGYEELYNSLEIEIEAIKMAYRCEKDQSVFNSNNYSRGKELFISPNAKLLKGVRDNYLIVKRSKSDYKAYSASEFEVDLFDDLKLKNSTDIAYNAQSNSSIKQMIEKRVLYIV